MLIRPPLTLLLSSWACLGALDRTSLAEPPATKETSPISGDVVAFYRTVHDLVKALQYPDDMAIAFIETAHTWRCEAGRQKLAQARLDAEHKRISWDQYAQLEGAAARDLVQTIRKEVSPSDIVGYYELPLVAQDKKAQNLGYTQLFYVFGNALGLVVRGIDVAEMPGGLSPEATGYSACLVGLHNGTAMVVDLSANFVSSEFQFTSQYAKSGSFWELRDKKSPLQIPRKIQLLDQNGLVAYLYASRGARYAALGQRAKAISESDSAVRLNPYSAVSYCARGDAYLAVGQPDEALRDFKRALELNPGLAAPYSGRARVYARLGELAKAIPDYSKAIQLDPRSAVAYCNRASVYGRLYQRASALADYNKAIELNPKLAEAYLGRGNVYSASADWAEAIADWTKAIELDPNMPEAYLNRAIGNARTGKAEEAKEDLRKAAELEPALREKIKQISDQLKLGL